MSTAPEGHVPTGGPGVAGAGLCPAGGDTGEGGESG